MQQLMKPPVDNNKKNFKSKPGQNSNNQNKANQFDPASYNKDKKVRLKDDVPKQKKNAVPKPKQ